ncbi:hypothetical protein FOHLNKBM_1290 [Methylobacterium longum]|nr:hypothetical protein FOHLNKBM_1290 [Methylobacterium longum]
MIPVRRGLRVQVGTARGFPLPGGRGDRVSDRAFPDRAQPAAQPPPARAWGAVAPRRGAVGRWVTGSCKLGALARQTIP